jgi:hypothetical protein
VPLAQWILVHGIYLDSQNVLALPTTGAAFTEVLPVDLQVRQMVRKELMLSVENIGSKPVVFQAAAFLDDLTGHGSTVVAFGPRQVQPGEIVELAVRIMQQGWFRTLRIPSYSRQWTTKKANMVNMPKPKHLTLTDVKRRFEEILSKRRVTEGRVRWEDPEATNDLIEDLRTDVIRAIAKGSKVPYALARAVVDLPEVGYGSEPLAPGLPPAGIGCANETTFPITVNADCPIHAMLDAIERHKKQNGGYLLFSVRARLKELAATGRQQVG